MKRLNLILCIVLASSLIVNLMFFFNFSQKQLAEKYPYLSKRILQDNQNDILINFLSLRTDLRKYTNPFNDSFAFYFEYLPTGSSIGINEKVGFGSASLIKVPVVMSYFHYNERVGLENSSVTIQENQLDSGFGDLWKRGSGTKISLEEAAELALVESDNTATRVLISNIPEEDFSEVYEGLDIDLAIENNQTIITVKHYSSILKSLYFSSLLTRDNSQHILELLAQTRFNDKLVAGVPKEVPVAHKFGVLDGQLFQDCGIVYVPQRPYLLCMMSNSTEDMARERMKTVSAKVYEYVSMA